MLVFIYTKTVPLQNSKEAGWDCFCHSVFLSHNLQPSPECSEEAGQQKWASQMQPQVHSHRGARTKLLPSQCLVLAWRLIPWVRPKSNLCQCGVFPHPVSQGWLLVLDAQQESQTLRRSVLWSSMCLSGARCGVCGPLWQLILVVAELVSSLQPWEFSGLLLWADFLLGCGNPGEDIYTWFPHFPLASLSPEVLGYLSHLRRQRTESFSGTLCISALPPHLHLSLPKARGASAFQDSLLSLTIPFPNILPTPRILCFPKGCWSAKACQKLPFS
jgi:hypothetical protein